MQNKHKQKEKSNHPSITHTTLERITNVVLFILFFITIFFKYTFELFLFFILLIFL